MILSYKTLDIFYFYFYGKIHSIVNFGITVLLERDKIVFDLPEKMHKVVQNTSQLLFHGRKLFSQWQQQTVLQKHW